MGFVQTTIVPPRSAHEYVRRDRLEDIADKICDYRAVTVIAPAGFGKTTAMLRWAELLSQRGRSVLWIAARAGIDSLETFTVALSQACAAAGLSLNSRDPRSWFVELAERSGAAPILFIDDGQLLPKEVHKFIEQLIFSSRDGLTTIIATRGESDIYLARLRSLGHLLEITVQDLCFNSAEASRLLRQEIGAGPSESEIQQMIADTQGWAAGLILASQTWYRDTLREEKPERAASRLRHEYASYFHEEVIEGLPQELRDFIVDTSILDELTPSACAAVIGQTEARKYLDQAFERGLFLIELDREQGEFRHYKLFKEMVQGRLTKLAPQRAAEMHRRASLYYAEQGDYHSALEHAAHSADQDFMASQIEVLAEQMIYAGLLQRLDELASQLSWQLVENKPTILLAMAWRRIRRLAFSSASRLIEAAERAINAKIEAGELDEYAARQLNFHVRHRKVMLEAARDNMITVERECDPLLADLGDDHPYLSCTLLAQLLSARRELYHFHDMLRLEGELRKALARPGSDFASIALKSSVAPTLVAQGKTETAKQFLHEAQEIARQREDEVPGLGALPALPLAEILYECGDLEAAEQLVDQYMPSIRQWGFVDQVASGYLVRARLSAAQGDFASALSVLEEAHLVAIECGLDRLRAMVIAEQVRILIKIGNLEQAEKLFYSCDLVSDEEPVPTLNPTRLNEWLAIAWLRIEMHRFRLVRSRKVAKRWLEFVRRRGAIRSALSFELLLAEIAVLTGNRSEARRAARSAVELAEPGGWLRPFLDEGEAIGSLILEAYGTGPILDNPVDRFAARLVSSLKGNPQLVGDDPDEFGPSGGLSLREIEILTQVSGGLRNREIGDRLGLTEGTVKWYMQQIYDKLGVRRRPQAVLRARQLGILS
jgi:LuxR family maltose regulon positive regulatory protein